MFYVTDVLLPNSDDHCHKITNLETNILNCTDSNYRHTCFNDDLLQSNISSMHSVENIWILK